MTIGKQLLLQHPVANDLPRRPREARDARGQQATATFNMEMYLLLCPPALHAIGAAGAPLGRPPRHQVAGAR